jgi:hypothetical protein
MWTFVVKAARANPFDNNTLLVMSIFSTKMNLKLCDGFTEQRGLSQHMETRALLLFAALLAYSVNAAWFECKFVVVCNEVI